MYNRLSKVNNFNDVKLKTSKYTEVKIQMSYFAGHWKYLCDVGLDVYNSAWLNVLLYLQGNSLDFSHKVFW